MGPFSAFFPPQGNKKRLEEIPNRNEIPLDRAYHSWPRHPKNHAPGRTGRGAQKKGE